MLKYWNDKGKYQKEYNELYSRLVPESGACVTKEGEDIRAVTKIYWDFANNGFGNNWSGAYNWLVRRGFANKETHSYIKPYMCGAYPFNGDKAKIGAAIDNLMDEVVKYVMAADSGGFQNLTPFDGDMYDYQMPDDRGEDR